VRARQPAVERDGLLDVGGRAVVDARLLFQSAPQQEGFGRVAPAEDPIDDSPAAGILAIADKGGSIQVIERLVGGLLFFERSQQRDRLLVSAEAVIATGQQQSDLVFELGRQ
jgi:hypothetical protein